MDDDEKYPTRFRHADGSVAYVFSSANRKTVARHFQWMEEHGIDGVLFQRFVNELRDQRARNTLDVVLGNVRYGAEKHNRTWALMYDLSGAHPGGLMGGLIDDWKRLVDEKKIREDRMYLHHNGKPVVSIWGIGFSGPDRKYTLQESLELITFLKDDPKYGGNTVMIGVPAYWRTLDRDAVSDPLLHEIVRKADIVSPWTVGRFGNVPDVENYVRNTSAADLAWCRRNGIEYMPVVFPGFSWHNMMMSRNQPGRAILRNCNKITCSFDYCHFRRLKGMR
jgi:hypothetical protein